MNTKNILFGILGVLLICISVVGFASAVRMDRNDYLSNMLMPVDTSEMPSYSADQGLWIYEEGTLIYTLNSTEDGLKYEIGIDLMLNPPVNAADVKFCKYDKLPPTIINDIPFDIYDESLKDLYPNSYGKEICANMGGICMNIQSGDCTTIDMVNADYLCTGYSEDVVCCMPANITPECAVNADCQSCFEECINQQCVVTSVQTAKPCTKAVWNEYPDCSWNTTDCSAGETTNFFAYLMISFKTLLSTLLSSTLYMLVMAVIIVVLIAAYFLIDSNKGGDKL